MPMHKLEEHSKKIDAAIKSCTMTSGVKNLVTEVQHRFENDHQGDSWLWVTIYMHDPDSRNPSDIQQAVDYANCLFDALVNKGFFAIVNFAKASATRTPSTAAVRNTSRIKRLAKTPA